VNHSTQSEQYGHLVKRAGQAAICAASLLIIVKLIAWIMTGSSSILAALTDSLVDVCASIINLFAIKVAIQPADKEHRFGHGKAESLAGLAQAAFISGSAVFLIFNGLSALINGNKINASNTGIAVMLFSVVVTVLLVSFQHYVVKKTNSVAIKADSLHYRTDIVMNAAVLFAIMLADYGWGWADGGFAIAISLYILHGAWEIGKHSVDALMDKQLPKEDEDTVLKIASEIDGIHGIHGLRTRSSGYVKFIQLHLELDDEKTLLAAHDKSDELELALLKVFPEADILIHLDPISVVAEEHRNNKINLETT